MILEIKIREIAKSNHGELTWSFRIYPESTRSWGWVPYVVEVMSHKQRKKWKFTLRMHKKLERTLWLPYQALREFVSIIARHRFAKYELETPNKEGNNESET